MLPEEVTKFIGQKTGKSVFQIQEEAIRRFADSVDDPNPLYWDEEHAKESKYGAIIAPPGLICTPWYGNRPSKWSSRDAGVGEVQGPDLAKAGYGRVLDGGVDWEFFKTVKAGDLLTSETVIKDITEREGRSGKMAFVIRETTYTDQNGELVAKTQATSIHPEGSPST